MSDKTNTRLLSLDTLRGFDMFWIVGGGKLIHALALATGFGIFTAIDHQLEHPEWHGFSAYDLIFPLFIFLAGVSTPYSIGSKLEKGTAKHVLATKIIRRGLILVLLGIVYNNGILQTSWDDTRFASVLGRIGLAGMAAQLIYLFSNIRAIYLWIAGILIGYWLVMIFVPVPGCGAGLLTLECNPASYLDQLLLPGRLLKTIHDPEGILSTIPAITAGLFGILAGTMLRSGASDNKKIGNLAIAGTAFAAAGILWSFGFPLNKNLWTSSFALVTGGLSFLLLALFFGIIDVLKFQKWTLFFVVIGTNSIVIYMAKKFIDFGFTRNALFGGLTRFAPDPAKPVIEILFYILVEWLFIYFLFRNKWFLKV